MTRSLLVALPLALALWNAGVGPTIAVGLVSAAGATLVIVGAQQRRYGRIAGGCFALLAGQVMALTASQAPVQLWPGVLYGLALLGILELAYDRLTLFRGDSTPALYASRRRYLLRVAASTVLLALVLGTLGVSFAPRVLERSAPTIFWIGGVSVIVLAAAAALLLRFWLREPVDSNSSN